MLLVSSFSAARDDAPRDEAASPTGDLSLPVDRHAELLRHHTLASLARFYRQNRALVDSSDILMTLAEGPPLRGETYSFLGEEKEVYTLDSRQYVFLHAGDRARLAALPRPELLAFMRAHRGALFNILHHAATTNGAANNSKSLVATTMPQMLSSGEASESGESGCAMMECCAEDEAVPSKKRGRSEYERALVLCNARAEESLALRRANVDLSVQLALRERELEEVARKNEAEKELLCARFTIEMQSRELLFYRHFAASGGAGGVLGRSSSSSSLLGAGDYPRKVRRVSDWLGGHHYKQDLSNLRQQNSPRWFGIFDNPAITPAMLHARLETDNDQGRQFKVRLAVPLTYRYSLRIVMQRIATACNRATDPMMRSLIDACPSSYQVVLYSTALPTLNIQWCESDMQLSEQARLERFQALAARNARLNCATLVTHAHFVRVACDLNRRARADGEDWQIRMNNTPPLPFATPALELLDEFYPAPSHYGLATYLTQDMTFPVTMTWEGSGSAGGGGGGTPSSRSPAKQKKGGAEQPPQKARRTSRVTSPAPAPSPSPSTSSSSATGDKKGLSTGKNKKCPFCFVRDRTLLPTKIVRKSHSVTNCPAIALLSNNEAEVLVALREACILSAQKKASENKLAKHKFLFGEPPKHAGGGGVSGPKQQGGAGKVPAPAEQFLAFDRKTLFRAATAEELEAGAHIQEVRLNAEEWAQLCERARESMRFQLDGPLFDALDPAAAQFASLLHDLELLPGGALPTVAQLIYDADGGKFLESRYEAGTRTPLARGGADPASAHYFSLDSRAYTAPRLIAHHNFCQLEPMHQKFFLDMLACGGGGGGGGS
jgi:hypothetical protein